MSDLPPIQPWIDHLCAELGVDPNAVDLGALLATSKDVAHHVDRPAVPITAFIVGLAAGQGASVPQLSARAGELARGWQQP
ncbi:MAG: DUF6457 domain-containing protein [Beutenbergiaceae bacterium]